MTRAELGVEYLKEAARLERYMRKVQKEPRTDNREQRLRILNEMYLECLATGHGLTKKGEQQQCQNQGGHH